MRQVIVITDGDTLAKQTVEVATKNIGGRCISRSYGNPTKLKGEDIANLILTAPHDPVVFMADDNGDCGLGRGEEVISIISKNPEIKIIGALAVASSTASDKGINVKFSINKFGQKVFCGVDKYGIEIGDNKIFGDTVDILDTLNLPIIVGIGDIGKMDGSDHPLKGARITTIALKEILEFNNIQPQGS